MLKKSDLILSLTNISTDDKDSFGEKAAYLGEMLRHGFPVPNGFVITPNAYRQFLIKYDMPHTLVKEIFSAYKRLDKPLKDATVEIFINNPLIQKKLIVKGEAVLLEKIKSIWNSLLTKRDYLNLSPVILVSKMATQSSLSGVMFTTDPIQNNKTITVIKEKKSDNYYEILKKDLKISSKNINKGRKQLLTDEKLIDVARLGKKLQEYCYFPQEVNFEIDNNEIYFTNIKPLTTLKHEIKPISSLQFTNTALEHKTRSKHTKQTKLTALLKGKSLYPGIATGHLRIIQSVQDIDRISRGEIIVIPYQDLIKHKTIKAGAIVATEDRFRHLSHPSLGPFFSGKPTILTEYDNAKMLTNGTVVTVNGRKGELYMGSGWQQ